MNEISSPVFVTDIAGTPTEQIDSVEGLIRDFIPFGAQAHEESSLKNAFWDSYLGLFEGQVPSQFPLAFHFHAPPGSGGADSVRQKFELRPPTESWVSAQISTQTFSGNDVTPSPSLRSRYALAVRTTHDMVVERAIKNRYNLWNDRPLTGDDLPMLKTAHDHGFQNWLLSFYTPFNVSKDYYEESSDEAQLSRDLIEDRTRTFLAFPQLLKMALKQEVMRWKMAYNPIQAEGNCSDVFLFENGYLKQRNDSVIKAIMGELACGMAHPDLRGNEDYKNAAMVFGTELQKIMNISVHSPKSNGRPQRNGHRKPASPSGQRQALSR